MRKAKGKDKAARGASGGPDPWQTAVYAFEGEWPAFNRGSLTLAECRTLVNAACEAYNVVPPPVRQHEGRGMSYSLDDGSLISLRLDHKNPAVVLHEAAHYITDRYFGKRCHDHGPTWQGVYFFLLARADIAPREALRASARTHGLRWRETGPQDLQS